MSGDKAIEAYCKEARTWEADKVARAEAQSKRDRRFAVAGLSIGALGLCAVIAMLPLKRIETRYVRVDNSTGHIDALADGSPTPKDWNITYGQLNDYVVACERYVWNIADADYKRCAAKNSAPLNAKLIAAYDRNNPNSRLSLYKDGTTVDVRWKSTTPLRIGSGPDNLAQIRFSRVVRAGGTGAEQTSNWIATVEYTYNPPKAGATIDPLNSAGFRVLDYQLEPEADGGPVAVAASTGDAK